MSTERIREAAATRSARRRGRDYRRTVLATVGVLALATTTLGVAGAFRPPRLDTATVAAATALERPGQRLVLQVDQTIDPVDAADVTIEPAVPIEVVSDPRTVTIRFPGMLRALTDYTVRVDVRGASTGIEGTLEHVVATPDLSVAVLLRDLTGPDQVIRRDVAGGAPEVLFAADRIQEYAVTPETVAAVLLGDSGAEGRLVVAPAGSTSTQEVNLPAPGRLQQLHASPSSGRIGVVFTATDPADGGAASRLLLFDPADPSGLLRPVLGLDGAPLSVLDWAFVPGTPYLVAHSFDEQVLLVDTNDPDAVPAPLGEHAELRGFLPGTLSLVVANPLSGALIDLTTGETTTFAPPDDGQPDDVYRGELLALSDDRYVEVVSRPGGDTGFVLDYAVLLVGPEDVEVLADPAPGVSVRDVCLSPNAQYAAVEVQDPAGEPDGYPTVSSRTATTTYFVDLETGAANQGIAGFAPSWCG